MSEGEGVKIRHVFHPTSNLYFRELTADKMILLSIYDIQCL